MVQKDKILLFEARFIITDYKEYMMSQNTLFVECALGTRLPPDEKNCKRLIKKRTWLLLYDPHTNTHTNKSNILVRVKCAAVCVTRVLV